MARKNVGYIDHFIKLHCAPELLRYDMFPNTKEITESMGLYYALGVHLDIFKLDYHNPNIDFFCVGDGGRPRTAALIACMTRWNCYSIDPEMNSNKKYNIDRLTVIKDYVQNLRIKTDKLSVIAHVHSHARIEDSLKGIEINNRKVIISIPCCVPQVIKNCEPDHIYNDPKIWSIHNLVKIWEIGS